MQIAYNFIVIIMDFYQKNENVLVSYITLLFFCKTIYLILTSSLKTINFG